MTQSSTSPDTSDKHSPQQESMSMLNPPSPMNETESLKYGRKREREVSVEPSTIEVSSHSQDIGVVATDSQPHISDLAAPTKKNKREPTSPTDSEGSEPTTPPRQSPKLTAVMTPQHESKVKQIRKRVEDMTWQDSQSQPKDNGIPSEPTLLLDPVEENDENKIGEDGGVDKPIDQEENLEKGTLDQSSTKRKLEDSTVVSTSQKEHVNGESVKRPRDDADVDANPRETKRPSPPPAKEIKEPAEGGSSIASKAPTSGFLSFASTVSPFGQAKAGPSAWSTSPSSFSSRPSFISSSTSTDRESILNAFMSTCSSKDSRESSVPPDKPKPLFGVTSAPGAGFTGFASIKPTFNAPSSIQAKLSDTTSPSSGPKRSKSPTHGSAFTPYNTSMRGFTIPKVSRRKRSPSPGGKSAESAERSGPSSWSDNENAEKALSFAERLREEDKGEIVPESSVSRVDLQEQELVTGEEDEDTVFSIRAKLYILSDQKQWKERGTGPLKVNVHKDGSTARLVMRKEGVHSLVLNAPLFRELQLEIAQDPRYVRFAIPTKTSIEHYNLRLSNSKGIEDFVEVVQKYIPQ